MPIADRRAELDRLRAEVEIGKRNVTLGGVGCMASGSAYLYFLATRTPAEADAILQNVEYHLLKKRGVIRYKGDKYYNKNPDGWSEEAEWTFGLSWLAIIYEKIGNVEKAQEYLEKAKQVKWWFKNGRQDGSYFAVPYVENGQEKPFYLDFVVMLND